jgi:hypothetical protein
MHRRRKLIIFGFYLEFWAYVFIDAMNTDDARTHHNLSREG